MLHVQGDAALSAAFPADPPTTTMQRIKALLTGSLPTFLDVGSIFTGGTITEDNVISQALAAGKRVGAIGDDTWSQLFPNSLNFSMPFPSFNVKDLHTVDDGVQHVRPVSRPACSRQPNLVRTSAHSMALQELGSLCFAKPSSLTHDGRRASACTHVQELMSELLASSEWDILVGHYLGMDHAGHTHGVDSVQMLAKIEQNDRDIVQVRRMHNVVRMAISSLAASMITLADTDDLACACVCMSIQNRSRACVDN